jgi:hypothetical protein
MKDRVTATCCATPERRGAGHTTTLLGHHQQKLHCATCSKEYSVDYNPTDMKRIADFEKRLLQAAQTAVDKSHPSHTPYVDIREI